MAAGRRGLTLRRPDPHRYQASQCLDVGGVYTSGIVSST